MQVNITFRHIEPTEALKAHVKDKVAHIQRYVDRPSEAHAVLHLENLQHHAEITMKAGPFSVRGRGKSEDMYASIDMAVDKIERQLKKYKERLRDHRPAHFHSSEPVRVRYEILESKGIEGVTPDVIRTDEFLAKPMNVEEALMQMDLLNNDFLVFTRPESPEDVSVVYRRKDGNFGLIQAGNDSTLAKKEHAAAAK